jgi:ArsR family transcriptional regulator, arsenate/arsenite/antimonite-responsive transcriptional repressor / arsenate reductase (thioredoxin)
MSANVESGQPPPFFRLAGHPVRWRILRALADGDGRVRELMASVREPQSLVSYHLHQLRSAGIVSMRRSSADGRDTYYGLNLARASELLGEAGATLHPGLRLQPAATGSQPRRRPRRRPRVLFLCTGNSARSQIAEALLQELSVGAVEPFSAGSHPKDVHPNAVRVMHARGIDISDRRPKHMDTFSGRPFDYVISLCDRVREICPGFPGDPQTIHWSIPDPAAEPGTYPAFERTTDELETRIRFLLHQINDPTTTQEVTRA